MRAVRVYILANFEQPFAHLVGLRSPFNGFVSHQ